MNIGIIVLFTGITFLISAIWLTVAAYRSFIITNHTQLRITAIRLFLTHLKATHRQNEQWFTQYIASQARFFRNASWACRLGILGMILILVQFVI